MWKYIVIVSLVLLAAGSFVFYKTHQGLVAADGEVAALQKEYEAAIAKNEEIFKDEIISAYAQMRGEWLVQCKTDSEAQEAKLREEDVTYNTEIERLEADFKSMGGAIDEFNEKKQALLDSLVNEEVLQKALSDLQEEGSVEIADMDSSDPEVLTNLAGNVRLLEERRGEIAMENEKEESAIQALQSNKENLASAIAKEDSLSRERQARVSPAGLNCSVVLADPSWEYVIVDAGVDAGIIIGSRLAVMRGDKKICEMNVTLVENNRSSCDIITDSLLAGEVIVPGDKVISVRPLQKD